MLIFLSSTQHSSAALILQDKCLHLFIGREKNLHTDRSYHFPFPSSVTSYEDVSTVPRPTPTPPPPPPLLFLIHFSAASFNNTVSLLSCRPRPSNVPVELAGQGLVNVTVYILSVRTEMRCYRLLSLRYSGQTLLVLFCHSRPWESMIFFPLILWIHLLWR